MGHRHILVFLAIGVSIVIIPVFAPSHPEYVGFDSPRKQIAQGIAPEEVICNEGLELIIKHNGSAACVRLDTAVNLEERGWGVMPPPCCKTMHQEQSQKIQEETPQSDGKTIEILGLDAPSYSPNTVTIKAGETLTFDNVDAILHTVTSGNRATGPDRNFNSDLLSAGEKFTLTLDKQGTYQYYCRIHPNMVGTIIVS